MKILIIKPSSLGDVVQTIPVLTGLRRQWPDAQIDWIVFSEYSEILHNHPALSQLIPLPRTRLNQLGTAIAVLKEISREGYDIALDLQGLLRSGIITRATGAPRRIGLRSAREGASFFYNEIIDDNAVAAADRYLQSLSYLGIPIIPHDFQLQINEPPPKPLVSGQYLVIHPYTRWKTKLWPYRNYATLVRALAPRTCVLIGNGPWFPCEGDHVIDLRNQLTLRSLLSVLQHSQSVVSTDSGPAHLAAALGRPTLTLFGATDPKKTAPYGVKTAVIQGTAPCVPCLKRECQNTQSMACMKSISTTNIIDSIALFAS